MTFQCPIGAGMLRAVGLRRPGRGSHASGTLVQHLPFRLQPRRDGRGMPSLPGSRSPPAAGAFLACGTPSKTYEGRAGPTNRRLIEFDSASSSFFRP